MPTMRFNIALLDINQAEVPLHKLSKGDNPP
jgi:hypothetical protein